MSISTVAIVNQIRSIEGLEEDLQVFDRAGNTAIREIRSIKSASPDSMIWIKGAGEPQEDILLDNPASLIVCDKSLARPVEGKCVIGTDNPKFVFSLIAKEFFVAKPEPGIHHTAYVHPEARIGKRVSVGPFTYIGRSVVGEGSEISGHCHIHDNVHLGRNNIIHSGCVIGDHGSGYARDPQGRFFKFPQVGTVECGDDVEIGANTYVNRGALDAARIARGSKIGNSVCIGHNVQIGEDSIVIANTIVAGSSAIGDHTWIAPSCNIRNGVIIGNNVMVGMGSVVTKRVEDGTIVLGNPAEPIENQKNWRALKKQLLNQNPLLKQWQESTVEENPSSPDKN